MERFYLFSGSDQIRLVVISYRSAVVGLLVQFCTTAVNVSHVAYRCALGGCLRC